MKPNCYLIKIPFSTKGEIQQKKNNALKISGYANYIYDVDKKVIIHEYLELIKGNYRLTDQRLIKPTDHYLGPLVRKFRDNILDPITKHNPQDIIKIKFNDLNQEDIININHYLKLENTTIKNQFSYFQGSNITGAKGNSKATPLVCTEQRYFGCNFANPMKQLLKKQKDFWNYQIIKEISLIEFISENKTFMNLFRESNVWYFHDEDILDSERILETKSEENYDENNINSWVFPDDLDEKISDYIDAYFSGMWKDHDQNAHKRILRTFFGSSVRRELNNKNLPFCASKKNYDSSIIENAHIISFAKLVDLNTKESILKAINPYNVLRIDSNHHKLFDKNKITFDLEGNVIKNDEILDKSFLDIDNLPKETINFIKENYEYWNTHKVNK